MNKNSHFNRHFSLLNYIIVALMCFKRQYVTRVKFTQKHLLSIIFLTNEFV